MFEKIKEFWTKLEGEKRKIAGGILGIALPLSEWLNPDPTWLTWTIRIAGLLGGYGLLAAGGRAIKSKYAEPKIP